MTEHEAIKKIRKDICCEKPIQKHCKDSCMYGNNKCHFHMAIKALETQIALKQCIENLKEKECFNTDNKGVIEILKVFVIDTQEGE